MPALDRPDWRRQLGTGDGCELRLAMPMALLNSISVELLTAKPNDAHVQMPGGVVREADVSSDVRMRLAITVRSSEDETAPCGRTAPATRPCRYQPTKSTSRTLAASPAKSVDAMASVRGCAAAGALPQRNQHQEHGPLGTLDTQSIGGQKIAGTPPRYRRDRRTWRETWNRRGSTQVP